MTNKKDFKVRIGGLIPTYLTVLADGSYQFTCDPWHATALTEVEAIEIAKKLQPEYLNGVRAYPYDRYN